MKRIFSTFQFPASVDFALLLLRIICGIVFITAGYGKIQHPFNWMGEHSIFPSFFQGLAAISEFFGGIALILGLVTRLAALGIASTMATAVYFLKFKMSLPFMDMKGGTGYDVPAILFFIALLFLVAGPGRFSLDRLLFGTEYQAKIKPAF